MITDKKKGRNICLFTRKNTFFYQNIWSIQKKAVILQPISELTNQKSPDGGIGRRAGLKHQ